MGCREKEVKETQEGHEHNIEEEEEEEGREERGGRRREDKKNLSTTTSPSSSSLVIESDIAELFGEVDRVIGLLLSSFYSHPFFHPPPHR